ncbi:MULTISPECIES: Lar family restriction alleviation protein [Halocynthiibacter]|uniref:Lar family restriction alleviation protein n=1 Tax=Halocynthiibacter halioticoli TaxID=2986804 RepID=A0AAE3LSW8_9RHOB|nr:MULTISPECIES: Lar family restriction alleviation protein [Halocynthiibacter]MCV6826034.1 Lar family restriction alleviation protein [Halocynthiibacter halioticoli]MCW4059035.1 Lar family restriction alleviation protein [Halocynthiibacter sp. SDUM655004]
MTDLSKPPKLLPCPFCEGKAHIHREPCVEGMGYYCAVKCSKCGGKSPEKYYSNGNDCPLFYEDLRNLWNTRSVAEVRKAAFEEAATMCFGGKSVADAIDQRRKETS